MFHVCITCVCGQMKSGLSGSRVSINLGGSREGVECCQQIDKGWTGAHQMEPPFSLISWVNAYQWVNPFPSRLTNRTIFFVMRLSRMNALATYPDLTQDNTTLFLLARQYYSIFISLRESSLVPNERACSQAIFLLALSSISKRSLLNEPFYL